MPLVDPTGTVILTAIKSMKREGLRTALSYHCFTHGGHTRHPDAANYWHSHERCAYCDHLTLSPMNGGHWRSP